ncbi:uncharacterized protein PpBr36_06744 [Pyricularia pennisetigena]|uniref:uncharacterized protein n=1 Tax=Pyricularia pennisetigena TaxID=1578925 RepID=UPI001153BF3E|nr:uncharacterized protein PpBr36_06744 [Pyricularia pennisetigena]TLS23355.1 hypothetical protein PpBr36_06744 [Pyricularia pennisetigena]
MAHHNIGEHSPFLKRVLVPFWVIRIIIMVVNIGLLALMIGAFAYINNRRDKYSNELNDVQRELDELKSDYNAQQALGVIIAILSVQMVFIALCLLGDVVCIVKRTRRTLTPKFFLGVNVFQTLFWLVSFILSMMGARSGTSIAINVIVLLSFAGLLVYASIVFHQWRTGKLPSPIESHQMMGKNNVETGYSPQTSYNQQPQYGGAPAPKPNQ